MIDAVVRAKRAAPRPTWIRVVMGVVMGLASAACGADPTGTLYLFGDASPASPPEAGASKPQPAPAPTLMPTAPAPDCPAAAMLIYVTGEGSALYSFDPTVGVFTKIGVLTCLDTPTHMTVDRTATAWVVSDGQLYRASTANASCSRVAAWTPDPVNFDDFALTFIGTTTATDTSLYVLGTTGELASFDTTSGMVTSMGNVFLAKTHTNASGGRGDMTTNGDGTLYYTDDSTPTQTLNEIDPTDATVLSTYVTGEDDSADSGALAFYGGLFYDFVGTRVFTFDTATMKTSPLGTAPLEVTGAGQSTCVPTTAPPPAVLH